MLVKCNCSECRTGNIQERSYRPRSLGGCSERGRRLRKKRPYDKSVYQSLALITQFGLNMLVPIGLMCALGIYLDRKQETSFWTILLFFIGAVAGAQNVYRMAKRIYSDGGSAAGKDSSHDISGEAEKKEQDAP